MAIKAATKHKKLWWVAEGGDDYVGNLGDILFRDPSKSMVEDFVKKDGAFFTKIRPETEAERDSRLAESNKEQ